MNEEFRAITDMPNRNVQGITGVQLVERVSPTAEDEGRIQHSVRLTVKIDTEGRAQLKKSLKSGQACNSINTLRDEMVKEFNLNSLSIEAKLLEPDDKQTKGITFLLIHIIIEIKLPVVLTNIHFSWYINVRCKYIMYILKFRTWELFF
jgi:hypothetical protein